MARVLQVLTVHGDKISSLQLASTVLRKSELINLLNSMRSLNEIVIKSIQINDQDKVRIKKSKGTTDSLKMYVKNVYLAQQCDRKVLSLLIDLPADSLDRLALRFPTNNMKLLQKFLGQQNQLKQLTIFTNFIQSISISHLRLTHLTIEARKISIQTIQSQQESLQYLCIMNFPINDEEIFDVICSLMNLRILKIFIGTISIDKISSISRLRYLEELTVKCAGKVDEEGQLALFRSNQFPLLRKLELLATNMKINGEGLRRLAVSFGSQLSSLRIEKISFEDFLIIIDEFHVLEELNVSIGTGTFDPIRISKHVNLKALIINANLINVEIDNFFRFFPRLIKLVVNNKIQHVK